jgi:hypothetical protein
MWKKKSASSKADTRHFSKLSSKTAEEDDSIYWGSPGSLWYSRVHGPS